MATGSKDYMSSSQLANRRPLSNILEKRRQVSTFSSATPKHESVVAAQGVSKDPPPPKHPVGFNDLPTEILMKIIEYVWAENWDFPSEYLAVHSSSVAASFFFSDGPPSWVFEELRQSKSAKKTPQVLFQINRRIGQIFARMAYQDRVVIVLDHTSWRNIVRLLGDNVMYLRKISLMLYAHADFLRLMGIEVATTGGQGERQRHRVLWRPQQARPFMRIPLREVQFVLPEGELLDTAFGERFSCFRKTAEWILGWFVAHFEGNKDVKVSVGHATRWIFPAEPDVQDKIWVDFKAWIDGLNEMLQRGTLQPVGGSDLGELAREDVENSAGMIVEDATTETVVVNDISLPFVCKCKYKCCWNSKVEPAE
ncbi:hypothetical protein BDY21DRAFT_366613 [Lineolata rhizophorae]|uniref:F-box domain-containing protein n=1 Tax=Lineolata rhizophorae TaxID=578093 RepID=A0A6A6NQP7_9PEZI|nr:hypothetical protein BDY21DRAFT_366613 [Lineolata rhizophorae]